MKSQPLAIREASRQWRGVHRWTPPMKFCEILFGEELVPINRGSQPQLHSWTDPPSRELSCAT
ncbi:MAG: hypothetical protein ABI843_08930 [Dokdonella sp.]